MKYDIAIIGAGPAGCATALALEGSGLRVALMDKQSFPRDKVCGDAIPGRAVKTLSNINPAFEAAFKKFKGKLEAKQTALYYNGKKMTFNWVGDAYTCTRLEFDNFLFSLVKEYTNTDVLTNTTPELLVMNKSIVSIPVKNSNTILEAKIVIGADGAQSVLAKQLVNKTLDREHHVGSVRAYFSNVTDLNSTEVYFDKRFLPSYLWIFPLPGNMANVGFGMLSSEIVKRKINLKKAFYEFIEQTPQLKQKLKHAVQCGDLEGFGLPLGSKIGAISGANFMLAGDAASLIDPFSGEGIGNAMLSGKLAAEQSIRCFQQNNFSPAFMKGYDIALMNAIGKELKTRYTIQRTLSGMPVLLDLLFLACKSRMLTGFIQKSM